MGWSVCVWRTQQRKSRRGMRGRARMEERMRVFKREYVHTSVVIVIVYKRKRQAPGGLCGKRKCRNIEWDVYCGWKDWLEKNWKHCGASEKGSEESCDIYRWELKVERGWWCEKRWRGGVKKFFNKNKNFRAHKKKKWNREGDRIFYRYHREHSLTLYHLCLFFLKDNFRQFPLPYIHTLCT